MLACMLYNTRLQLTYKASTSILAMHDIHSGRVPCARPVVLIGPRSHVHGMCIGHRLSRASTLRSPHLRRFGRAQRMHQLATSHPRLPSASHRHPYLASIHGPAGRATAGRGAVCSLARGRCGRRARGKSLDPLGGLPQRVVRLAEGEAHVLAGEVLVGG